MAAQVDGGQVDGVAHADEVPTPEALGLVAPRTGPTERTTTIRAEPHNGVGLADGRPVTRDLFVETSPAGEYRDFLTLPAYARMP